MIPIDTIDKLEAIWRSVSSLGSRARRGQWKLPTDLAGWTVQDNLAHLIGTERMLQGLPSCGDAGRGRRACQEPASASSTRTRSRPARARSGAEVLAEFDDLVDLRLETLRAADDDYFAREMVTPTVRGRWPIS